MELSESNEVKRLSELTPEDFQKFCTTLRSRGLLKEGSYTEPSQVVEVLRSSLGVRETLASIQSSLGRLLENISLEPSDVPKKRPKERHELSSFDLHQLMDDLEKDQVLSPTEREHILKNPDLQERVQCLFALAKQKSQEARGKVIRFVIQNKYFHLQMHGDHRAKILHMKSRIVSDVSSSVLRQLLDDLVKEDVLSPIEAEKISKNRDHRQSARSLMNLFLQKGQEASRKMLLFLKLRDPRFDDSWGDHRAELKRILSWPGRGTSSARLHQLWDDLEKEDVLTPTERGEILKNPTRETILRSLIDLVVQKSQEATRKMLLFLRLRDPKFEETIGDHRAEILHMKSRIVSDVSSSVLRQLLNDLVKENVLIPIEAEEITKNPDHRESARSLMNLFLQKGQEASRKMLLFLKLRDPRFDDNWCDHQAKFRYIQRSRISFYGLHQLLSYLEKEDVLTPTEREEISKNPTCETILRSLFELLVEKSEEASRKMLLFLELRNPELEENNDPENDDLHMRYWFESDLSPSVPRQLLDDLVKENVLSPIEAEEISKNPDHRESAQSLMNLVLQKGQEASRKMLLLVKLRDPRHHRICDNSMKPNWGMSSGSSGTWKMDMEPSATGHRAKTRFEQAERLTGSTTLTEDEWTMLEPIVSHLDGPWYRNVEPSATGHSEKTKFEQAERLTGSTTLTEDEWTMLEPLVSHLDGPWYSFQCGPGKFECSLSSLRWICTDTMSFKYRFEPWWEHKDKLEAMQYIAGGPLLDISVDEGQFDDVYLPHWICTAANPSLLEHFAVLRVDDDGYIVEEVSEVTSSHVRLPHPIFSVKGVIIRFSRLLGISLPMKCKVLIYKTTKTFLTLHVHVILCDPALEKELDKETYVKIEKSHLEEPMKLDEQFSLKADVDSAEIYPPKLRLKHESDPNFFEVYVKSPGSEFTLMLESAVGEVWRCKIRQNDYQNATPIGSDCVQVLLRVRGEFVKRISEEVMYQLLDDLLGNGDLNDGEKDAIIQKSPICAGKVRELIDSVRRKGEATSRNMIVYLQRRDLTLHTELGLPVLE
ncbi:uncharacterized protein LOC133646933 isoform X5 [Entelurus aequoreus]|uniref:uncharacterized protein LOC133646933 isoform X5 n=1 Tax=Entelurus aequoreus TaxID=161455 RepID=UPI002B1D5EA1|nr:uncharacterized protein LOC133646933 isoform X5 [Entelurus aequoreus]